MPTLDDLAKSISMHRLHGHIDELVIVVRRENEHGVQHACPNKSYMIEVGESYCIERMSLGILSGEDMVSVGSGEYFIPVESHAVWTRTEIRYVSGPILIDRILQYGCLEDAVLEAAGMKINHPCSIIAGNQNAVEAFQCEYDRYSTPHRNSTIEELYILATYAGAREILDGVLSEM